MNETLQNISQFIKKEHPYEALLLYGSRSKLNHSPTSDYDLVVLINSDSSEFHYRQLSNPFHLELDCVFVPLKRVHQFLTQSHVKQDEPFRYFCKSQVIDQINPIGTHLINQINHFIALGPVPISDSERREKSLWLFKMFHRSLLSSPVAQFRKHELFSHLLYSYFYFRNLWYLGVKESFAYLQEHDKEIYEEFLQILNSHFQEQNLAPLLQRVIC